MTTAGSPVAAPARRLPLAIGLALALTAVTLAAPSALAAPPSCAVSNARNHKGYDNVQSAVDAAKAGDTLEIKGTCAGTTTVSRDVTLAGVTNNAFPGTPTLDGGQAGRVLDLTAGTTTIRNLLITNGRTTGNGGGMIVRSGAGAQVFDSAIRANTAGDDNFGGGIESISASVLLVRTDVSANRSGSSGGIDMDSSTVSLVGSRVADNVATHQAGGGDGCLFGVTIFACAAGVWNFHGTLSLTNSTITGNTGASRGGGIRTDVAVVGGSVVDGLTFLAGSSTIQDNVASDSGGGIWSRARQAGVLVDPSPAFRVADGSSAYTDPLTSATLPAWTGGLGGNSPDQCFGLGFPTLTLGTHTCGVTFN